MGVLPCFGFVADELTTVAAMRRPVNVDMPTARVTVGVCRVYLRRGHRDVVEFAEGLRAYRFIRVAVCSVESHEFRSRRGPPFAAVLLGLFVRFHTLVESVDVTHVAEFNGAFRLVRPMMGFEVVAFAEAEWTGACHLRRRFNRTNEVLEPSLYRRMIRARAVSIVPMRYWNRSTYTEGTLRRGFQSYQ